MRGRLASRRARWCGIRHSPRQGRCQLDEIRRKPVAGHHRPFLIIVSPPARQFVGRLGRHEAREHGALGTTSGDFDDLLATPAPFTQHATACLRRTWRCAGIGARCVAGPLVRWCVPWRGCRSLSATGRLVELIFRGLPARRADASSLCS